jgi:hypothetical protein
MDNESIYALILFPCVLIMCVSLIFVISGNKKRNSWPHQNTVRVSLWAILLIVLFRLYADRSSRLVVADIFLLLILAGTMVFYYREYLKYKKTKKMTDKMKRRHIWESDEENGR